MEYVIGFTDYVDLNTQNQSEEELLRALVEHYGGAQGALNNFLKYVTINKIDIKEVNIEKINDDDRCDSKEITN